MRTGRSATGTRRGWDQPGDASPPTRRPGAVPRAAAAVGRLAALLLLASACRRPAPPPVESAGPTMGTVATVSVPAAAAAALPDQRAEVAQCFAELEQTLSIFRPDSDLARLNAAAGGEPLTVGTDTLSVLSSALRAADASGGAFDPTVGPLMAVWGFRGTNRLVAPPGSELLAEARARVGWTNIVMHGAEVGLRRTGMRLDLGGIAKGYAVDVAWNRLRAAGVTNFTVNLGGNLRCGGQAAPDRPGWRVGVRNPFDTSQVVGLLVLQDGEAVATSGNYERFVTLAGRRYAHIIDPRSGRPVEGMAGVTVLAPTALDADALSTSLFVLGPQAGLRLLREYPGCEVVWIPDAQPARLLATPGFARRFVPQAGWERRIEILNE